MEGFQRPTSAILILSQGSAWHGNLILGIETKKREVVTEGDVQKGILKKKVILNTLKTSSVLFVARISGLFPMRNLV